NKGVPYLMDVPVIGHLFKSRSEVIKKTELVIIITPHIVTGEKDVLDKPIAIKGQSLGYVRSASFQESALDMFTPRSFTADPRIVEISEGLTNAESSKPLMDGLSGFPSKISSIKKGK
ncbi:MAG: hypothetical protein PHV97_05730, partial [Candidatus Omnitrophica bacterium]|nr:hypothetical protein [Candidatus Omnitrophota bacterium]